MSSKRAGWFIVRVITADGSEHTSAVPEAYLEKIRASLFNRHYRLFYAYRVT